MQRKSVGLFKKLVNKINADENDAMMDEVQAILDNADEVLASFSNEKELALA